jgi:hypothetical protein
MDEITLPWHIAYARDLPVHDTTEAKQSLAKVITQIEKLLPTMLLDELPQWLERFQKNEQGRMKYLIACREQAQALLDWHQFRSANPAVAALPASADALKLGIELGIQPDDWPSVPLSNLQSKLHAHLRDVRNDAMLAALDTLYVKTIALVFVAEPDNDGRKKLEALVNAAKQSAHNA